MWINKKIIFGIILVLFLSACASKKIVSTAPVSEKELSRRDKKNVLEGIAANTLLFETFSTKAKTKLSLDNKSFNATLNIRIKHDEVIWISANAFLGIEAARIMITPDRIQIINRLQSTYIDKPFDYIYNFTSKELSFAELEDLFVGNSLNFYNNPTNIFLTQGDNYKITGSLEDLIYEISMGTDYNLTQTKLSENGKSQTLQFNYPKYGEVDSQSVPNAVNISLKAAKMNLAAEMKFEDISLNQDLSFPFTVPQQYKKI